MRKWIAIAAVVAGLIIAYSGTPGQEAADAWDGKSLVVHEWGTFTTVQGSDGVVLDGLSHEERDLPKFVYDIRDFAGITGVSPKMETPVIYFYSPKSVRAQVYVKFPRGVITQWYPAAHRVNHQGATFNGGTEAPTGREITELKDGFISWGSYNDLLVLAPGQEKDTELNATGAHEVDVKLPEVAKDDPWCFCREVDANTLRACNLNAARKADNDGGAQRVINEYEKCLFYRGLGDFPLPLTGEVKHELVNENGMYELIVSLTNSTPDEVIPSGMVLYKQGGKLAYHFFGDIRTQLNLDVHLELEDANKCMDTLIAGLAKQLIAAGLYRKEAYAMAHTWQNGYFRDDGLRVLYILPAPVIARELPLKVSVAGKETEVTRVFVGRTELLSPTREKEMETLVRKAADGDAQAMKSIAAWGRFATPYLKRIAAMTEDAKVKAETDRRLEAMKLRR